MSTPQIADGRLSLRIAFYLDGHPDAVVRKAPFLSVLDDAYTAEEAAKLHGLYPPAGHGYPREGL